MNAVSNATPATPQNPGPALRILVPVGHAPSWLLNLAEAKIGGKIEVTTYVDDAEFKEKFAKPDAFDVVSITDRLAPDLIQAATLAALPQSLRDALPRPQVKYLHHYFDPDNTFTYPYGCTLLGYIFTIPAPTLKEVKTTAATSDKSDQHSVPSLQVSGAPKTWKDLQKWTDLINWPPDPSIKDSCQHFFASSKAASTGHAFKISSITIDFINHLKIGAQAQQQIEATPPPSATPNQASPPPPPPSLSIIALPTDGSLITMYNWALVKQTSHLDAAASFMELANSPENEARLATENDFAVTQTVAIKALSSEISKDPLLYPPDSVLDHCEFVRSKPVER